MARAQEDLAALPQIPSDTQVGAITTVAKGASHIGVTPATLYAAIRDGRLPAFAAPNLGRTEAETVVRFADLEAFAATKLRPNKRRTT